MMVLPSRSPPSTLRPFCHQVREHLVDRVLVEQPLVDLGGLDAVGDLPSSPHSSMSHWSFSSSRQVVVADARAHELERHRDRLAAAPDSRRPPPRRANRRRSARRPRGRTANRCCWSISSFGVAVSPTSKRVEVLEDRPVLLVDRAVRLVDDDQVEVAGAEASPCPSCLLVDQVHHRRIGGDEDAALARASR